MSTYELVKNLDAAYIESRVGSFTSDIRAKEDSIFGNIKSYRFLDHRGVPFLYGAMRFVKFSVSDESVIRKANPELVKNVNMLSTNRSGAKFLDDFPLDFKDYVQTVYEVLVNQEIPIIGVCMEIYHPRLIEPDMETHITYINPNLLGLHRSGVKTEEIFNIVKDEKWNEIKDKLPKAKEFSEESGFSGGLLYQRCIDEFFREKLDVKLTRTAN